MIKQAEVQNAYLQGRQAAMIKLAQEGVSGEEYVRGMSLPGQESVPHDPPVIMSDPDAGMSAPGLSDEVQKQTMYQQALAGLRAAGANQMKVLGNIGLTGQGLYDRNPEQSAYDPRQLATLENLSRAGMLAGAGGGAYLGGMDPRAAAIASAGALGGGLVGGNLGQAASAALRQFGATKNLGANPDMATSIGGALGGLGGGLGAGGG